MVDMRTEFPAQTKNRERWILDVVRANQTTVSRILGWAACGHTDLAKADFDSLYKNDRDALLQPNGILTDEQIELLK